MNVFVLKTQLFPNEIFVILQCSGGGSNKHKCKAQCDAAIYACKVGHTFAVE